MAHCTKGTPSDSAGRLALGEGVVDIYSRLKTGLSVLQLKTGSKGINLSEALFGPVELEHNFSSSHVKDGGMYFVNSVTAITWL